MTRSINKIVDLYKKNEKIVCLTSYTASMAKIADEFADLILVGDSLEMVLYGNSDTTSLELDCIIRHAKAVCSYAKNAFVVCDVPFGYYEESAEVAFKNISTIIKQTGADAIKIEGGEEYVKTIEFLTSRGIMVMGHIGLMPQRVRFHGSYKPVGNSGEYLLQQAKVLESAGVFSIVLENCDSAAAEFVTKNLSIPTIGIGSGIACSGQIAVFEDICGLSLKQPPFAKKYANLLSDQVKSIAKQYSNDVRGNL